MILSVYACLPTYNVVMLLLLLYNVTFYVVIMVMYHQIHGGYFKCSSITVAPPKPTLSSPVFHCDEKLKDGRRVVINWMVS